MFAGSLLARGLTYLSAVFLALSSLSVLAHAQSKEPIRIGWLSSLTGPLSSAAIAENKGVQFAVDEINKGGGILGRPLELLTRDTAGEPTKAVNFANQLLHSDKVHFIIGPVNSGETLATVGVVAKAGIPNLIIGALESLTDPVKYPRAFRPIVTNGQWIKAANDYAVDVLKKQKIAIVGDTSGYGTASAKQAADMLAKRGIKPVISLIIDANKADLTDEFAKMKAAGADVIMPWTAATSLLARMLNTRGDMQWDVPVVGHPALMALPVKPLLNKPDYWKNAFASGYRSSTFDENGKLPPRTVELMEKIKPSLGGSIDFTFWWVQLGYDCVKIIEHAVKTAGSTDPAAITKALNETKNLEGSYATYSWSPKERDAFPDADVVMNVAGTFKEGSFQIAPSK
ncbi:MAG: ABC transporter substrate-binding protein [Hyphomicrobiaceae bacterium]